MHIFKTALYLLMILLITGCTTKTSYQNTSSLKPLNSQSPIINSPKSLPKGINRTSLNLTVTDGFELSIFAKNLGNPRVINFDESGTLLVSLSKQGKVVAIAKPDKDQIVDKYITVAENLNQPHGLVFHNHKLYIAQTNQVSVFDYNLQTKKATNSRKIIDLPSRGNHWSRTILIHNNKLYTSVGSTCNVCNEKDDRRAKVLVSDLDGKNLHTFASGLRNAPFMTLNSNTNQIWATEMGRDLLGDDIPPDEINILDANKDYGWPICYGKNIHDDDFDKNQYIQEPCKDKTSSYVDLQAHSAPLGLDFLTARNAPEQYQDDLLVAYHGSWNRSVPTGYKIVRLVLDNSGKYSETKDFITGWLGDQSGRPVDIKTKPNSSEIYISDDKAGLIYKLNKI